MIHKSRNLFKNNVSKIMKKTYNKQKLWLLAKVNKIISILNNNFIKNTL